MKKFYFALLAATLIFSACSKGQETGGDDTSKYVLEIGATIEKLTVKSVADPESGKIRFEAGDRILLDNGSENAVYVWNSTRSVFVPDADAVQVADAYKAVFPASKATGSTPGNLVIDAPVSIDLSGNYIKDLPLRAETSGGVLVFKPCSEVIGPKPHVQQGSGTQADPYIISEWTDFKSFVEKAGEEPNTSAYYKQTADITLPFNFHFTAIPVFKGNYDGGGHKITGLVLKHSKVDEPAGLFSVLDAATVKGLELQDIDFVSDQMFFGAIAGKALNSTIEDCRISGYMKSTARFTWSEWSNITTDSANHGFVGGLVGYSDGSTVKGCTFSGQLSSMGKNTGGIAGYVTGKSVLENCTAAEGSEAYTSYHCVGGIAGAVTGGSTVKGCTGIAAVSALGYWVGGIVGYLQDGSIEGCVTSSRAIVSGRQYSVGGIVGGMMPRGGQKTTVSGCASYADVQGQYNVGGIAGTIDSLADSEASVSNCAFIGGTLYATGTNSSNYNLVGGIVGWIRSRAAATVENCASMPALIKNSIQNAQKGSDNAVCVGGVAGLVGFKDQDGTTTIKNCWSNLDQSKILVRYKAMSGFTSTFIHYGSVYGGGGTSLVLENCWRDESFAPYSRSTSLDAGCPGIAPAAFTNGTLLASLGSGWVASASGFPVPKGTLADPSPKSSTAKRVSVIGDSISTFAGYIPAGYNYHYPNADGAVTQVSQTYWYRLIYDKLSNAVLDLNMSYSGSAVTRSTNTAKSGNHWYENSYIQRYIRQGGVGNPDIVLIHGGTNDWAHNDCPLYPGDNVLCRNAYAPQQSVFDAVFEAADKAHSYEEAAALPDTDFLSAYAKLVKMLQEQYPGVKIVCIVGDYLSEGVEQCVLKTADHFGAKSVNLLRVNGFNDQVNMPKHDYNGSGGCHPNAKAMAFIADKIYTELGSWLEN